MGVALSEGGADDLYHVEVQVEPVQQVRYELMKTHAICSSAGLREHVLARCLWTAPFGRPKRSQRASLICTVKEHPDWT